jgi:hypothetical protein
MNKFLKNRNIIGTALQFFGLGLCVHDFIIECQKISSPYRMHGFWLGIVLIIAGWVLLSIDLVGDQK